MLIEFNVYDTHIDVSMLSHVILHFFSNLDSSWNYLEHSYT